MTGRSHISLCRKETGMPLCDYGMNVYMRRGETAFMWTQWEAAFHST